MRRKVKEEINLECGPREIKGILNVRGDGSTKRMNQSAVCKCYSGGECLKHKYPQLFVSEVEECTQRVGQEPGLVRYSVMCHCLQFV